MLFFNISVAFCHNFFVSPSRLNLLDRLAPLFYTIILYLISIETVSKNSDRFKQQGQTVIVFKRLKALVFVPALQCQTYEKVLQISRFLASSLEMSSLGDIFILSASKSKTP